MADSLRDLVVSLSLNTDNFTKNIAMVNRQIKEAESAFKLAGAGITNFGSTSAGAAAYVSSLQQRIGLQRNVVDQYGKALTQANQKLTDSYNRYTEYGNRLNEAKTKLQGLSDQVKVAAYTYETFKAHFGENDTLTQSAASNLRDLSLQYQQQKDEVEKLAGQYDALRKSMENAANAVSTTQTALNNATAKLKDMERELQTLTSGWTKVGNTLVSVGTKMQSVGKGMASVGKVMTMAVTLPIAALGKNAAQASIDFESSFTSVRKTVNATEEEFARLADASKEMSTQVAASTTEINEVMATGGQLGIATENLEDFTKVMIDLGNSTEDLDAQNAATQLAKFANVMGTDQSKFQNIGSTIVELGNNFATTEAPIVEMAQRLAGAGKQVGLTEAQVLGFATALSSVGIQAQMGGSAMSKALIKMEVAAESGGQALDDFAMVSGMTASQFQEVWRSDPAAAFQAFINGLSKLDDEGASAIKTLNDIGISEVRLRDTLMRATNANELFARAQVMATNAWQKNTALTTEANKRYATLESRLANLKNKATLLGQTFGNDLRPTIEKLMQGADSFIEKLMNMDSGSRQLVLTLAGIAAAAGPVLLTFGKITEAVGSSIKAFGNFAKAIGSGTSKMVNGLKAVVEAIGAGNIACAGIAAGFVAATAAVTYFVSGAHKADAAMKALNENVKKFDEDIQTSFEKAGGMSTFGLSADDFKVAENSMQGATSWFESALKTWTDGKKETDEIVTDTVKGFTDGTDTIRNAMKTVQSSGGASVLGDLDGDIKRLDEIDAEVAKIFKSNQNGLLSEDDKQRLQELIDERGAIEIKYHLVADSAESFEKITDGVESALSRGADAGKTYTEAFAAATQGEGALIDSINAEYDARYAAAKEIEDSTERENAMKELSTWYDEQRTAAVEQYAQTLKQISDMTGVFGEGGEYEETSQHLTRIGEIMKEISENGSDKTKSAGLIQDLSSELDQLDESQLVELNSAISAMQMSADQAGVELPADIQAIADALNTVKAAGLSENDLFPEDLQKTLKGLFGGLDEETAQVYASLNVDNLTTAYDAWAAGDHADIIPALKTDPLIEVLSTLTGTVTALHGGTEVTVDIASLNEMDGTVTVIHDGVKKKVPISELEKLEGTVAYVKDGVANKVDIASLKDLTALVSNLRYTGSAPIPGLKGTVTALYGGAEVKVDITRLNTLEGTVTIIKDGVEQTVPINQLSMLTGTVTYVKDGVAKTVNVAKLNDLQGVITKLGISPDAEIPEVPVTAKVNFEQGTFTTSNLPDWEYDFANANVSRGGDSFIFNSNEETVIAYASALREAANAQEAFNTAKANGDADGMQNAATQLETTSEKVATYRQELENLESNGLGFEEFGQKIANGLQLIADGAMGEDGIANLQALSDAITTISDLDSTGIGSSVSEGIAEGMNNYGYDASASTVASAVEAALRAALQINSPSGLTKPLGSGVSEGVGVGMTEYSFDGNASTAASNLQSAASGAFTTSLLKAAGLNAMTGLASGIRSGTSYVTSAIRSAARAAVAAAKSELVIKSPSHVFRDEVGVMTMRGFGEGVLQEMDAQARVIRNAARYLTSEAKDGVTGIVSTDNRKTTYNETSSVNLYVDSMSIRDRQDIESLASEIASLTKRRQVGRGMA